MNVSLLSKELEAIQSCRNDKIAKHILTFSARDVKRCFMCAGDFLCLSSFSIITTVIMEDLTGK